MFLSLILFLIIITLSVLYLNKFKRKTLGFLLVFILITIPTTIIYLSKGNLETFFFEEKINKIVQEGINDPENFKSISPQVLIIFLEKKLKKEPNDLQGWLILSRTCVMSGNYQKAEKYYKNALELFPKNEKILLEIALLKKKTNKTESAENYLNKLKILYPYNIKARELLIEIFTNNYMQMKAIKEYKELTIIKKGEKEYLESIKKKYNLY